MTKRILSGLVLAFSLLPAWPQVPRLSPSAQKHHWGFVRKSPCAVGDGDHCVGSNPTTWHATPDWCGTVISTSAFRNPDGTTSTDGARITLPRADEFAAAGYTAGGATGAGGTDNREGQCEISFVQGLPLPANFLRLGVDGVQGADKVTFMADGVGHDMFYGDMAFPAVTGTITVAWNGLSWLAKSVSPAYAEKIGNGQMSSQGQGRLFPVTQDPPFWSVGTKVGSLAYCPVNGLGTTTDSNGTTQLVQLPANCVYFDPTVGTATEWIGLRSIASIVSANTLGAGAAYSAGTAPNGVAYAAGNYPVIGVTSATALATGTTVTIHNLPTTLGAGYLHGKFIVKVVSNGAPGCTVTTCLELHERVVDTNAQATSSIGPPAYLIPGDTILAGVTSPVIGSYLGMQTSSISAARYTDPAQGTERESTNKIRAILGIGKRSGGVYTGSANNLTVASWFNPLPAECVSGYTVDRTTTSTTFVEPTGGSEARCNFIFLNHTSSQAKALGDVGRGVPWSLTMTVANNTANSGCEISVGFDGTTAESKVARVMNGATVQGAVTLTVSGVKTGLTENSHYITPLLRVVGTGSCTASASASNLSATVAK